MTVCVVGGGPAGMMAAIFAASNGNKVTLIEQNEKLGKKLFLTGKGRCNLSNACPVEELFDNITTNPKFLYSSFYGFDNSRTVDFFNDCDLPTKVERGGRVFPVSDHSSDVIKVLRRKLEHLGVNILLDTKATDLIVGESGSSIAGVIISKNGVNGKISADKVIMATGGMSYPRTGSDGVSFDILKRYGIDISLCEPSLVPFVCDEKLITDMQGLTLKNVGATVYAGERNVYSGFGEMLFTHFGLSGPLILSASSYVREKDYSAGITVCIDLKPALSFEVLDKRLIRDFEENRNRKLENSLGGLLPSKMITAVIQRSGVDPEKRINSISKQERQTIVSTLKDFIVHVTGNRGFDEAVITRGGVKVSGIDPSSMESRKIKGLFFAGEMIDVDALTGGFNLQIAWSTGYMAALGAGADKI